MTLTVLSKIMEIIVKSYSLIVCGIGYCFVSERGSQNITDTVFGLYQIIIIRLI
jgi:hypothetical protein